MNAGRIFRYRLDITDQPTIDMPPGALVLSVGPPRDDTDRLDLWALVRPAGGVAESREFRVVGTGNPLPGDLGAFIGSVTTHGGALVWHVFEAAR